MNECQPDRGSSSKKRKLEDSQAAASESFEKQKTNRTGSSFDANLNLDTTLPTWEWQRYLDIKSGHVYFYNTRTRKNSPRFLNEPELPNPSGMRLDLDLNLPCGSARKNGNNNSCNELQTFGDLINDSSKDEKKHDGLKRSPSWLTFETDEKEMVTAVCNKCHMLVMMCKSCPACPNCKFMHPPDHNLPSLFLPNVKPLVLKSV
ncbi:uncharacterized protein LOC141711482 [Apium graveolens]|uniref:uncharacterized protein LOC141711482 n=1 Tax=Apium graveolens TaxID=4045 RepID=UPI003D799251